MNKVSADYILEHFDEAMEKGYIKAFYMPIIRASNGRVCHEEALARWIDPEAGFLTPDTFIPVLEKARLIHRLDLHILEDVLDKMHNQTSRGLFLVPISINLSRVDFDACDIVTEITERVDASGISRDRIIIEVTEDVAMNNEEHVRGEIERFKAEGFSVWMDDFGSGYSSIDILQDISFDRVKLDMSFMKRFDQEKCRVVLSELCRMFMSLGMKTVAEGVETREQADFLRSIGCNELQGYYFCKPISTEEVFERYEKGTQIGFENPGESEYYDTIGTVNLYDMSLLDRISNEPVAKYFETLPVVVYEVDEKGFKVVRCNPSYRTFENNYYKPANIGTYFSFEDYKTGSGSVYADRIRKSAQTGAKIYFDERLPNGSRMHGFVRKIAENPVTGKVACTLIILEITEHTDLNSLDFMQVAQALSSDYISIYCVNLESGYFIEYGYDYEDSGLSIKCSGKDFFDVKQNDLFDSVYEDDREMFYNHFTREKINLALHEFNKLSMTYRQIIEGKPVYVNLKVVRMNRDEPYIIVGISNIDIQVRYQKELVRIEEERTAYSRVMALAGNFICIYSIDPETLHYVKYQGNSDFDALHLSEQGEDFFSDCYRESADVIYPEDLDFFRASLNRDKVFRDIEKSGEFSMIYRLMLNGRPEYMNLKAVINDEAGKKTLVLGVSRYS